MKPSKARNLFLYDHFGSADPDIIYSRIWIYGTCPRDKNHILDHLSILISGLDGDERKMNRHHYDQATQFSWTYWYKTILGNLIYVEHKQIRTMKKEHV